MDLKSKFFKDFGIPDADCDIDPRRDDLKLPRLFFVSRGNPVVGLDMGGATKLKAMMESGGEAENAKEIGEQIAKARRQ